MAEAFEVVGEGVAIVEEDGEVALVLGTSGPVYEITWTTIDQHRITVSAGALARMLGVAEEAVLQAEDVTALDEAGKLYDELSGYEEDDGTWEGTTREDIEVRRHG